jgi:hypothetical protein
LKSTHSADDGVLCLASFKALHMLDTLELRPMAFANAFIDA